MNCKFRATEETTDTFTAVLQIDASTDVQEMDDTEANLIGFPALLSTLTMEATLEKTFLTNHAWTDFGFLLKTSTDSTFALNSTCFVLVNFPTYYAAHLGEEIGCLINDEKVKCEVDRDWRLVLNGPKIAVAAGGDIFVNITGVINHNQANGGDIYIALTNRLLLDYIYDDVIITDQILAVDAYGALMNINSLVFGSSDVSTLTDLTIGFQTPAFTNEDVSTFRVIFPPQFGNNIASREPTGVSFKLYTKDPTTLVESSVTVAATLLVHGRVLTAKLTSTSIFVASSKYELIITGVLTPGIASPVVAATNKEHTFKNSQFHPNS